MRVTLLGVSVVWIAGCSGTTGPATTDTLSSSLPTLPSRVEFLQRYVTLRGGYTDLSFHVVYHNNGGGLVPGPSEWDVRLLAEVPPGELEDWAPAGVTPTRTADTTWLASVPGVVSPDGITEWYVESRRVVGIDRKRAVVAYRSWTY